MNGSLEDIATHFMNKGAWRHSHLLLALIILALNLTFAILYNDNVNFEVKFISTFLHLAIR